MTTMTYDTVAGLVEVSDADARRICLVTLVQADDVPFHFGPLSEYEQNGYNLLARDPDEMAWLVADAENVFEEIHGRLGEIEFMDTALNELRSGEREMIYERVPVRIHRRWKGKRCRS